MENLQRFRRTAKVNPVLLGVLGILVVVCVIYFVFFRGEKLPPPVAEEQRKPWTFYHHKTGETFEVPYAEAKELKQEDGLYEYPPGSGKFLYMRQRPGQPKMLSP